MIRCIRTLFLLALLVTLPVPTLRGQACRRFQTRRRLHASLQRQGHDRLGTRLLSGGIKAEQREAGRQDGQQR